jgi:hypothetical protein
MGMMHPAPRTGYRTGSPWPRRQRRRWTRGDDVATVGQMLAAIPSLPRAELSRLTERLIDRMDELDGDPDLEPEQDRCGAADDGCGAAYNGRGEIVWGTREEDPGVLKPIYSVDQTLGPINYGEASQEHHARDMGLVRSPRGGWMWPR